MLGETSHAGKVTRKDIFQFYNLDIFHILSKTNFVAYNVCLKIIIKLATLAWQYYIESSICLSNKAMPMLHCDRVSIRLRQD